MMGKPDTTMKCQNCDEKLQGGYWEHNVSAVERSMTMAPDGSAMSTVVRSALACSWRCLAVLIAEWSEPDQDEVRF